MARAEPASTRPFWPRFALIAGLGSAALALAALSQFARGHALMINTSPSLPYWAIWLDRSATPARGDIAVFKLPADPSKDYIKRVIGLPGDRIALDGGRLYLNGERVARKDRGTYAYRDANGIVIRVHRYDEVLPGGRTHAIIERTDSGMADTMAEMTVPEGQLFVLGDNRDNSLDSRFEETGLVPVENLQGRADLVGWSFYTCKAEQGLACAKARFLTMLR